MVSGSTHGGAREVPAAVPRVPQSQDEAREYEADSARNIERVSQGLSMQSLP